MAKQKKSVPVRQIAVISALVIAGFVAYAQINLHKSGPVTIDQPRQEAPMIDQINEARAKAGKKAVVSDPKLTAGAEAKVTDQVSRNYWAHHLPGEDTRQFLVKDYPGKLIAENLAKCQKSDSSVIHDWTNSPSHYQAMVGDFDAMGYAQKVNPQDQNCIYTVMYFIKY
jgi:uncharacterized protein YkwD